MGLFILFLVVVDIFVTIAYTHVFEWTISESPLILTFFNQTWSQFYSRFFLYLYGRTSVQQALVLYVPLRSFCTVSSLFLPFIFIHVFTCTGTATLSLLLFLRQVDYVVY